MSEQYYTPRKEDIRIGLEYEFLDCLLNTWRSPNKEVSLDVIASNVEFIRVPYLTKEQIEQMGFQCVVLGDQGLISFKNYTEMDRWKDIRGQSEFAYTNDSRHKLFISTKTGGTTMDGPEMKQVYAGRCRCINDLKLIIELLDIKP